MNLSQIAFEEIGSFSSIFLDYINNKKELQPFFDYSLQIDQFEQIIERRGFEDQRREILTGVLNEQYKHLKKTDIVAENIEALKSNNTFTITTGHQLNIFTGPLFFIYKVAAVINMARKLNQRFPEYHFVPVYWMASEDHDFAEINHFRLFGEEYVWQQEQSGPVGRLPTNSMKELLSSLPERPEFCVDAYLKSPNLAAATRRLVHYLFGEKGLIVLDADHAALKKEFIPVIKEDIFKNQAHQLVLETSNQLEKLGYKSQVFPREINFFYMEDGLRERIELSDDHYRILNTDLSFTEMEMDKLVEQYPERFSPNVVMRPVYQETILPNLAYVGGPAEIAYWLQLKQVFQHCRVSYPAVFPRLFATIIPKALKRKMNKLEISNSDVFRDFNSLKEQLVFSNTDARHELRSELETVEHVFQKIMKKAEDIDKSLSGFVASEQRKVEKEMINIEKKLKKAIEARQEIKISQLKTIMDGLFPKGNPQEREENFLNFYINNIHFVDELIEKLDPFELQYNILTEDA